MENKKERKSKSGLRGMSRFCAVQAVYRAESCGQQFGKIIDEFDTNCEAFISENVSTFDMDKDFFLKLLNALNNNLQSVDEIITKRLSQNWRFERLDSVTKCILRLGVTELMNFTEIPSNVILNEYIEISKAFFETKETSFINGLLNKVSNDVRNQEKISDPT
jgi:N utilization substance protein B